MKEQIKAPEKIQQSDSQPANLSDAQIQTLGYQDAHRNGWVWLQIRGKNEGYAKWSKGKCTGNQQWREGNGDSHQQFQNRRKKYTFNQNRMKKEEF